MDAAGVRHADVEIAMDRSKGYISRVLKGALASKRPKVSDWQPAADLLNVPLDWLVFGHGETPEGLQYRADPTEDDIPIQPPKDAYPGRDFVLRLAAQRSDVPGQVLEELRLHTPADDAELGVEYWEARLFDAFKRYKRWSKLLSDD
ncbi:MAG: hypothetical protein CL759_06795 [Chloroflexi bacterium]|nr:hypothetical protein [Chloroflexota bacterium]